MRHTEGEDAGAGFRGPPCLGTGLLRARPGGPLAPLLPRDGRLQWVPGSSWNSSHGINTPQKGGGPGQAGDSSCFPPQPSSRLTRRGPAAHSAAAQLPAPAFPRPEATGHSRVLQQHLTWWLTHSQEQSLWDL